MMIRTDCLASRLTGSPAACLAVALLAFVACSGDDNGNHTTTTAPTTAAPAATGPAPGRAPAGSATPAARGPARVVLAATPDIDLVDNRFLWHLSPGSPDGLLVPMAAEGFRKYTQEYSQPWGEVLTEDGVPGRVLTRRSAALRIPWSDRGPATVRLRVHGGKPGQRLTVEVNGARIGNAGVDAAWTTVELAATAGALRPGENEITVFAGKRGGPGSGYGLWHSIEVVPGAPTGPAATGAGPAGWPVLSPAARAGVGGVDKKALRGLSRMFTYVEIPATAWLEVATGAAEKPARFTVRARTVDGEPVTLLSHEAQPGAWQEHQVSLADLADHLVELSFAVSGEGAASAAWGAPRIALEPAEDRPRPPTYRNAIVLVIDALRSDRLALYGDTRVQTPRMTADGRARGVTFLYNQAASPSSPPSHGSIQTGMIPRVHGVTGDKGQLIAGTPMISTQLGDAGVATGYFGNNPFGMARLEKPGRWTAFHQPAQEGKGIDCTALMTEILGFVRAQSAAGKRFFVSSLPYETHTPYRYHEGISERYHKGSWGPPVGKSVSGDLLGALSGGKVKLSDAQWSQLRALYDGEAEYMDGCYGQLLDGLAEIGVTDDTLLVITSDHGEGMFEHGRMGHAFGHYAELADVPLVLIGKGLVDAGIQVRTVTSHLDIVPTILDLMGVTPDPRVQGRSLVPIALRQGPWTPRVIPLEYGRSYALRAARWKYIVDYGGDESVYDLVTDPTEQNELSAENPMALRYLRDVAGFFLAHRTDWRMATFGPLNDHDVGFLRHVGAGLLE